MKLDKETLDTLKDIKRFCDFIIARGQIGVREIGYLNGLVKDLQEQMYNKTRKNED